MRSITLKRNTSQGAFLSIKRLEKGLSVEAIGKLLNVTGSTVHRWEIEGSIPGYEIAPALADILGVSLDELLRPADPKPLVKTDDPGTRRKRKQAGRS